MTAEVFHHGSEVDPSRLLNKLYRGRNNCCNGSYAQVWDFGKGVVKYQSYGSGYIAYLRWMINNQNNPYIPRLYRVDLFQSDESICIVYMEKLKEICSSSEGDYEIYNRMANFILYDESAMIKAEPKTNWRYLRHIRQFMNDNRGTHSWDIHDGNIMLRRVRGKYRAVLTDPLS